MRTVAHLFTVLAALSLTSAFPSNGGYEIISSRQTAEEDVEIVDLKVTDEEHFPGQVFYGTLDSVEEQMKALKPELFANVTETQSTNTLRKRAPDSINCSWGSTRTTLDDCRPAYNNLANDLNNRWCTVAKSKPNAPRTCARVQCATTCGVFLCNKKVSEEHSVRCRSLGNDLGWLIENCQWPDGKVRGSADWSTHYLGVKGQMC